MLIRDICVDFGMKETILYENQLLPHSMYIVDYDNYERDIVPWHWHDELELLYIRRGKCIYRTSRSEYILREGDAVFLNSGVLHDLEPLQKHTISCTNLFKKEFLTGGDGNFWDLTYMVPVLQQKGIEAVPIYHGKNENIEILKLLEETIRQCTEENPFYEIRLRNILSEIWIYLFEFISKNINEQGKQYMETYDTRMKKMLLYIMEQYTEKITVSNLATSANISERECFRLFQKQMGESPNIFMQKYRIQIARNLLITTDKSVAEIAAATGFDSISYFSKIFKRYANRTPLEFRVDYMEKYLAESL